MLLPRAAGRRGSSIERVKAAKMVFGLDAYIAGCDGSGIGSEIGRSDMLFWSFVVFRDPISARS
jgi:hypothetical protein